jgi:hypothetical protein
MIAENQLRFLFDSCEQEFFKVEFSAVERELDLSLKSFNHNQLSNMFNHLNKICENLKISTEIRTKEDVARIILASSYWSYNIKVFAANMIFIESFKTSTWTEVEKISGLPFTEIARISDYFEKSHPTG